MTTPPMRFEDLLETYHDEIFSYLSRMLYAAGPAGWTLDAADICQDTFIRAYHAIDRLRPGSNERAWLYRIATNCAYSALRTAGRAAQHTTALEATAYRIEGSTTTPERMAMLADQMEMVLAVVEELPFKQRTAVILRYLHEMTYEEIAEALDCSYDSARANVSHGVRRLRAVLTEGDTGKEAQDDG